MELNKIEIGKNIRKYRQLRGLTQAELAEVCGFHDRSTLTKIETGKNLPTLETVCTICQVLDVSADTLLGIHPSANADTDQDKILRCYNALPDGQRSLVMAYITSLILGEIDK